MWTASIARRLAPWLLLALIAAYAVLVEPRWVARRDLTHTVAGWQGPDGLKVAIAADWHITRRAFMRVMTIERARAIVRDINAARPDIILLPGDLVASELDEPALAPGAQEVAAVLGELRAPLGVHAVLGNHDWWQGGPAMAAALKQAGIRLLDNEAHPLAPTPLWLVGIGDDFTGHADAKRAVARLPAGAHALVLMHDPAPLTALPPVQGLIVAGHTHGGQVYLPLIGALSIPTTAPRAWAYGWVTHGPNRMYVTSGLGVSVLPLRFNMRPEWALITIRKP
jgi:predicted MPP superfamily phosphohydrolase